MIILSADLIFLKFSFNCLGIAILHELQVGDAAHTLTKRFNPFALNKPKLIAMYGFKAYRDSYLTFIKWSNTLQSWIRLICKE